MNDKTKKMSGKLAGITGAVLAGLATVAVLSVSVHSKANITTAYAAEDPDLSANEQVVDVLPSNEAVGQSSRSSASRIRDQFEKSSESISEKQINENGATATMAKVKTNIMVQLAVNSSELSAADKATANGFASRIEDVYSNDTVRQDLKNYTWANPAYGEKLNMYLTQYEELSQLTESIQAAENSIFETGIISDVANRQEQQVLNETKDATTETAEHGADYQSKLGGLFAKGTQASVWATIAAMSAAALALAAALSITGKRTLAKGRGSRLAGTRYNLGDWNTATARKHSRVSSKIAQIEDRARKAQEASINASNPKRRERLSKESAKILKGRNLKRLKKLEANLMDKIYGTVDSKTNKERELKFLKTYSRRTMWSVRTINKQNFADGARNFTKDSYIKLMSALNKYASAELNKINGKDGKIAQKTERDAIALFKELEQNFPTFGTFYFGNKNKISVENTNFPVNPQRFISLETGNASASEIRDLYDNIYVSFPNEENRTILTTISYTVPTENGSFETKAIACSFDNKKAYSLIKDKLLTTLPANAVQVSVVEEIRAPIKKPQIIKSTFDLTNKDQKEKFDLAIKESKDSLKAFDDWWETAEETKSNEQTQEAPQQIQEITQESSQQIVQKPTEEATQKAPQAEADKTKKGPQTKTKAQQIRAMAEGRDNQGEGM